ncbi:hypothetical protein PVAP13_2NG563320 [Panicum virgatum]|uniref:Uncharacterized protein n=1 Tax=Panicum virgatum TaxID=38727 RepID=A0A8T0VS57_PANVG|nr:hypothetical protein PVAP13_2NG563320 [Panicum virgatum]
MKIVDEFFPSVFVHNPAPRLSLPKPKAIISPLPPPTYRCASPFRRRSRTPLALRSRFPSRRYLLHFMLAVAEDAVARVVLWSPSRSSTSSARHQPCALDTPPPPLLHLHAVLLWGRVRRGGDLVQPTSNTTNRRKGVGGRAQLVQASSAAALPVPTPTLA